MTSSDRRRADHDALLARLAAGQRAADDQEAADARASTAESRAIAEARHAQERRATARSASEGRHADAIRAAEERARAAAEEAANARAVTARHGPRDVGPSLPRRRRPRRTPSTGRRASAPGRWRTTAHVRFGALSAVGAIALPLLGHPAVLAAIVGGVAGVAALVLVGGRLRTSGTIAPVPLAVALLAIVGIVVAVARLSV